MNNLDELIASFVTEIIKSNLPNIGWVIRLHPNQTKDFEDIRQFLQEKLICQNFFLEKPEHSSLYGLLKISNYLITKWSSVAYEALSFNINPIITDQNGKVLFSEKIKTGVFNYAENEQQLYDIITENKEFVSDDNPFIDTCSEKAHAAMNFIISH
jgi:CDP-glycerol glycerophosphotransferase (TagB/SpsB family)